MLIIPLLGRSINDVRPHFFYVVLIWNFKSFQFSGGSVERMAGKSTRASSSMSNYSDVDEKDILNEVRRFVSNNLNSNNVYAQTMEFILDIQHWTGARLGLTSSE